MYSSVLYRLAAARLHVALAHAHDDIDAGLSCGVAQFARLGARNGDRVRQQFGV